MSLSPTPTSAWTPGRWAAALALAAGGIFATRGAWADMLYVANRDPEASHVYLVPFLAIWLVWLRRRQLQAVAPSSSLLGPLLVAAGWGISHWGFFGCISHRSIFGAVLVLVGCLTTVLGVRAMLAVWPAILVLACVIPVPGMVRQRISIPLEHLTAYLTTGILKFAGAPVERTANQIFINDYPVTVAEACNGLRMIFPLFLVVYVFCFMLPLRTWVRWALLLSSPLCAVVCNVLRLLPTILLFGYANKKTADLFHDYSGWPMVLIAFLVLMGGIKLLRAFGVPVIRAANIPTHAGAFPA